MSITNRFISDVGEYQIVLSGKFDFSKLNEFRTAYENAPGEAKKYAIDMRAVDMIDSSALGMLLLLRDHAGGDNSNIKLQNCNEDIKKILTISNFEQLFSI